MVLVLVVGYLRRADRNLQGSSIPLLGPAPITIVPGIHMLGGLNPAAVYVVETSEGLVLIDSGLEHDASLLKSQMADLGLDWKRIRAILLTHVHGDHSGGAQHLRQATGATVYAGSADAQVLRDGGPREAFFSTFNIPNATASPTTVDVELQGAETPITIGDARFRALATPGHSPGCICYLLERNNRRVLFSGDVIMSLVGNEKSAARMARPLGTYAAYLPPRYRGNAKDFLIFFI